MAAQSNTTKQYTDFLGPFPSGCNSGVAPLLLPKDQLAFSVNTTVRGAYVTDRPPYSKKQLVFDSPLMQTTVEKGLFQGGEYYRPDFGTESLIAQISGHLFKFTETGTTWMVSDISVPGDPNSATTNQVWMWQFEKWMNVQDGTGVLPIFFDGVSSRRSYGPSVLLGVVNAVDLAGPNPVGTVVTATLNAVYAGPFNVPVLFNGAFYQPSQSSLDYTAILTNITAAVASTIPTGSTLVIQPGTIGYTSAQQPIKFVQDFIWPSPGPNAINQGAFPSEFTILQFSVDPGNIIGQMVQFPGTYTATGIETHVWTVIGDFGAQKIVRRPVAYPPLPIGTVVGQVLSATQIQNASSTQPNVIVGTTTLPFVVPAVGSSGTVHISSPYSGAPGQAVWIGQEEFSIAPPPVPPPSTTLYLINLTDTGPITVPGDILSVPELPAGRMGVYGMGRNWMSLTDGISFLGGDIVGGPAGTPANNYRDSVLKTTENTFQAGGGSFRLPGTGNIITSMKFVANLDTSLGQGPLQVGTQDSIFSVNSPVDRTTWATLTNPILTESLIGLGPLAQNSTVLANSDMLFRSVEGFGSLVIARRNFGEWGNTPISREMERVLDTDNKSLLPYGSGITFDNRLLMTAAPNVSGQGVFHIGIVAMNFDALSNLKGRTPPCYDGVWTGINTLQLITGSVNGHRRAFSFSFNITDSKIELYELLATGPNHFDNGNIPIEWIFETPVAFNQDIKPLTELIRLTDGEIYVQDIVGTVNIEVQYRPDFYPCWTTWRKFDLCADTTVTNGQAGYRCRVGLGEPDPTPCEAGNDRPLRVGNFFQFRVVITGHLKWMGMKVSACTEPQPKFALPACDPICETGQTENCEPCQIIACVVPKDLLQYSLQGLPPQPLPPAIPVPAPKFGNDAVYYDVPCEGGTLTFTGTLPGWITLDVPGNRLVGAPGTFLSNTKAAATAAAQAAINTFGAAQVLAGNLVCVTGGTCDGLDTNIYEISGYVDGMISNAAGSAPVGGEVVWDGTFPWKANGNTCKWMSNFFLGPTLLMDTKGLCLAETYFLFGTWILVFYSNNLTIWGGSKASGSSPAGVYTRTEGLDASPATITLVSIGGATTDQDEPGGCPPS